MEIEIGAFMTNNEGKMNKPTCEQLIEQLGDKQDITICSDVVYGLAFEYQQLKNEVDKLNDIRNEAIKYNKELAKIYDLGSVERSNADTNLIILREEEHMQIMKEIAKLKVENND